MSISPTNSREVTPSTISASSPSTQPSLSGMDRPISGGSSSETADSQGGDNDDADKFRRRVELEQTMQVLQQRLELANLKAKNGWTGMTINEIENKLPPAPRRRREDMRVVTGLADPSGSNTSNLAYEPPSPSRPWQLVDVLWQPLPPPSRGYPNSPHSPNSPLKRTRDEDDSISRSNGLLHQRRASGSNQHLSPVEHIRRREKQRSQSHSHTRLRPTPQDFTAAQALTEMLSGSPSAVPSSSFRRGSGSAPLANHHSLPLPPAFDRPARRSSSAAPGHRVNRKAVPDDEDKDAAELMMFLAQSPSANTRPSNSTSPPRNLGGTPRVLFADEKESDGQQRREERSNLSSATPITATDQNGFGALL